MSNTELAFSIRLAAWGHRVRGLLTSIAATALVAGCTVQLTAPYNSDIDTQASALQSDFLRFAAEMQMVAGTPKGYYDEHASQYADFEARLMVIRMRSESLGGGVSCGRALEVAKKVPLPLGDQAAPSIAAASPQGEADNANCITILVQLAQNNMERLRSLHQKLCNRSAKVGQCTALFSAPPIFDIFSPGKGDAPSVLAVAISLNELVGAERDIKPPGNE
ncbi:MAG: hypothetical protein ACRC67_20385 [Inquilinus sp.]|uniref:hypothetical protein n=1 Tax=Inquilinus sp. TaxID=1932117 RepID=UPI003F3A6667